MRGNPLSRRVAEALKKRIKAIFAKRDLKRMHCKTLSLFFHAGNRSERNSATSNTAAEKSSHPFARQARSLAQKTTWVNGWSDLPSKSSFKEGTTKKSSEERTTRQKKNSKEG